jgi:hypothetical protein
MGVMSPIKVTIRNRTTETAFEVPDFPFDPSRGKTHTVVFGSSIFIDGNDFRMEASEDYFGLSPGKLVSLKYCSAKIKCVDVVLNSKGEPTEVICDDVSTDVNEPKAKVAIQWVPEKGAVRVEVRNYGHLFVAEEVADAEWESLLNPKSEILEEALVDPSIIAHYKASNLMPFQFERVGFYVCDKDSTADRLVFNLTVALKDSKPPADIKAVGASKSRKEEQDKALAEKLARQSIKAEDFFKVGTHTYIYCMYSMIYMYIIIRCLKIDLYYYLLLLDSIRTIDSYNKYISLLFLLVLLLLIIILIRQHYYYYYYNYYSSYRNSY